MSRRITIRCQMNDPELLLEALNEQEINFTEPTEDTFRIFKTPGGDTLMYGGIKLEVKGDNTVRATYDEDCALSEDLMRSIQQQYVKRHYLLHAMRQGDQIQEEFVATGNEEHAQIEEGDVVIIASKL